jgi:hypothetical protein
VRAASAISEHFANAGKPMGAAAPASVPAPALQTTPVPCVDEAAIEAGLAALLGQRGDRVWVEAQAGHVTDEWSPVGVSFVDDDVDDWKEALLLLQGPLDGTHGHLQNGAEGQRGQGLAGP